MASKVLVADDDGLTRIMFNLMLKRLGFNVCAAASGFETEDIALRWSPDAILLDCHMPIQNGYVTSQRVRQRGYTGYIILMSVMSSPECPLSQCGANAFIQKPITIASLKNYLVPSLSTSVN